MKFDYVICFIPLHPMADMKLVLFFVLVICFTNCQTLNKCNNKFNSSSYSIESGNGGFHLFIRDKTGRLVDRFTPNEEYVITVKNYMIRTKFNSFQIETSPEGNIKRKESMGKFILPNYITEDSDCPRIIKNKKKRLMRNIQILWKAPEYPEKCITFQAILIMSSNVVYKDSHTLKKKICANEMYTLDGKKPLLSDGMKIPFKQCCACGTASYFVTFRGLWNRTTHPRDWPTEKGQLHWTDPIGATHNHNYMIYYIGGQASQAVDRVCTTGDSSALKEELISPDNRDNVKSLFKSQWMNGEEQLNGERTGFISVNKTHNLFSFISMMGPSTDWCTGISGLDLCMEGCRWKSNISIPLYPFDVGVKTGDTYKPNESFRLDNPDPIREINQDWMKNNPFTLNKPVAEIILTRMEPKLDSQCNQKPLEKVVEIHNMDKSTKHIGRRKHRGFSKYNVLNDPQLSQMAKALCGFSQWTSWSPCSEPCGVGESYRSREMIKNLKNELCIYLPTYENRNCEGKRKECDFSKKCSLLPWSEWSSCTATCKTPGKRVRSRRFARVEEKSECLKNSQIPIELVQMKKCILDESDGKCDPIAICSDGKVIRCTTGKRSTRYFYNMKTGKCEIFAFYGCKGSRNNFISKKDCEETCFKVINQLPKIRRSNLALLQSQSSYSEDKSQSVEIKPIPKQCFLQLTIDKGCKNSSPEQIWYYNHRVGKCRSLIDFFCQGDLNRFPTFKLCMETCMPNSKQNMDTIVKIDCEVSNWSDWSHCSKSCGWGKQFRQRTIRKDSINGGKPCPNLYDIKACFYKSCQT